MTATCLDITIEQGADYVTPFTFGFDLTGYAAYMQIRIAPNYPSYILNLSSAIGTLLINMTDETILPVIPASVSATILAGRYVYDLLLVSPAGLHSRAYQGKVYVSPEVTNVEDSPSVVTNWDAGGTWDSGLTWDASASISNWDAGGQWDGGLSWDA